MASVQIIFPAISSGAAANAECIFTIYPWLCLSSLALRQLNQERYQIRRIMVYRPLAAAVKPWETAPTYVKAQQEKAAAAKKSGRKKQEAVSNRERPHTEVGAPAR